MARRQTLVQLTDDMVEILDALALKKGTTRSGLIRSVLEEYLKDEDEAAKTLAKFYEQQGRKVRVGRAGPDDVVESLQPFKSPNRFPQWKTMSADLVLLGTPANNVLLLDQGFVDLGLHPLVKQILGRYLGTNYELTEAKGWKSLPTRRDFHGWHGDAWYDQTSAQEIHREVKLAMYLTDVRNGAFNYLKGSHQGQHPRLVKKEEITADLSSKIVEMTGPAGTAFLFDTSGIHRQAVPVLEPHILPRLMDPRPCRTAPGHFLQLSRCRRSFAG